MIPETPWASRSPQHLSLAASKLAIFAAAFVTCLVITPVVQAEAVQGEVLVILAKEEAGEIDPALANVAALERAPFNAFRSMEVLSKPRVQLRPNAPHVVNLPNGRRLQVILQQVLPDGRFRVRVSINRPNEQDYLPLLTVVAASGDPFFVAGQNHAGGTLIIGVRLGL